MSTAAKLADLRVSIQNLEADIQQASDEPLFRHWLARLQEKERLLLVQTARDAWLRGCSDAKSGRDALPPEKLPFDGKEAQYQYAVGYLTGAGGDEGDFVPLVCPAT